jgi:hypothetical protein
MSENISDLSCDRLGKVFNFFLIAKKTPISIKFNPLCQPNLFRKGVA